MNAYVIYEFEDGPDVIIKRIYIGDGNIPQLQKEFRREMEQLVGLKPPEPQVHDLYHGNVGYKVRDAEQTKTLGEWRRALQESIRPREFAGWLMRKRAWQEVDEVNADQG